MAIWPVSRHELSRPADALRPSIAARLASRFFRSAYASRILVFELTTRLITWALPPRKWYGAIWLITRTQSLVFGPLIRFSSLRNDFRRGSVTSWLLDSWLQRLTRIQPGCPVPLRVVGQELLQEACRHAGGAMFCTAHVPLVKACVTPLARMNPERTAVVIEADARRDDTFPVWGEATALAGIPANGYVLVRVRRVLQRGGSVALLVDNNYCESYSSHALQLCRKAGAQLVFMFPELQADGSILVEYCSPPDPYCRNDESIANNLAALKARADQALRPACEERLKPRVAARPGSVPLPASVDSIFPKGGRVDS